VELVDVGTCRRVLGKDCPYSDSEIEALRDSLYHFADIVIAAISPIGAGDKAGAR
jgi:hypothetical protein